MSKETVKVVEIDTNPAVKSLKDLRKELLEYKNQMSNLEEGSDAFLEIANKAGEVKHQIDEINESIKGASADFGDMLGNVSSVAAGMTGAFQAVAGGLQAIGVESEAVDKAILKMQGLMAVTQGLGAIDNGIKSWDKLSKAINVSNKSLGGFKKALIGTGLGALVVVLGSIIANWDEFSKSIGISESKLQKFGDMFKGVLNVALSGIKGIGTAISRLIAGDFKGAQQAVKDGFAIQKNYQIGVQKAEEERTEKQRKEAEERIAIERKEAEKKREAIIKAGNERLDIQLERIKRNGKTEKENLSAVINVEKERLKLYERGTLEYERQLTKIRDLQNELNSPVELISPEKELDIQLERIKRNGKTEKENLSAVINVEKERLKLLKEGTLEYERQLTKIHDLQTELDTPETNKEEEKLRDYLQKVADMYLVLEETDAEYFARREEELKSALEKGIIDEQQYTEAVKGLAKERSEYQSEQNAILVKNISDTINATSGFITGILDSVAEQQDTNNKEGFEKSKKLQIASTTIQMLTGIATALSGAFTTKSGPWDIVLAGIQAASIAASGIMNINKIKSTKFDGGGSASANISSGAINSTMLAPTQISQAVQNANTEGAIKNQKVVVLESDIVNTIDRVNTQVEENTY